MKNILERLGISKETIAKHVVKVEPELTEKQFEKAYHSVNKATSRRYMKHRCPFPAKTKEYRNWMYHNVIKKQTK